MKYLILSSLLIVIVGCANNNEISITNNAQKNIAFNFRSKLYNVSENGGTIEIKDIPNGNYSYSTTYTIPGNTKSHSITTDAAGGSMDFSYGESQFKLLYASTFIDSVYNVNVTISTTNSNNAIVK